MADDKHLVCFGATVYCNKSQSCNNPGSAVPLNITSQTLVVINGGKLAATNKDNTVANMNFGACSARHNAPCSAQVEWTKFYQNADVAGTLKLLTEESEGLCTCGGGKIKIAKHGQVVTPQSIEMDEVSVEVLGQILPLNTKKPDVILQDAAIYGNVMSIDEETPTIKDAYWIDKNNTKIRDLETRKEVVLYLELYNYEDKVGQTISFDFGDESDDGYKKTTFSGTIGNDGIVKIENFKLKKVTKSKGV